MRFRQALCVVLAGMLFAASHRAPVAQAIDSNVLSALYGEGMKAYYSGRYTQAHETFSQAIEAGSKDPRCFYFRGLSNLKLGRGPDAGMDFEKGAAIEAADFDVFFNVSGALERVQGPDRLTLERYRADGRKHAQKEIEKIRFEHYRRFAAQQPVAGAATVEGSAPAATGTAPAAAPAGAPAESANPFGAPAAAPATPAPAAGANPFGGAAPAAAPAPAAGGNPFGQK
jgi:hypothetical protein